MKIYRVVKPGEVDRRPLYTSNWHTTRAGAIKEAKRHRGMSEEEANLCIDICWVIDDNNPE